MGYPVKSCSAHGTLHRSTLAPYTHLKHTIPAADTLRAVFDEDVLYVKRIAQTRS
jgi:hypothetical protein